MELIQLRYFQKIAEYENMSQAAVALSISQPALSRSLTNLEAELSTQLFDRSGRRLKLNESGQLLLSYATQILNLVEATKQSIQAQVAEQEKNLSISMLYSTNIFPRLIPAFNRKYPNIKITLTRAMDDTTPASKKSDISIFSSHVQLDDPNLTLLLKEECHVGISVQNPLSRKPVITLDDLSRENFVLLTYAISLGQVCHDFLASCPFTPNIIMECYDQVSILSSVSSNLGIGFFPSITWDCSCDEMVIRPLGDAKVFRYIYLTHHASLSSPAVKIFRDFARNFVLKECEYHLLNKNRHEI